MPTTQEICEEKYKSLAELNVSPSDLNSLRSTMEILLKIVAIGPPSPTEKIPLADIIEIRNDINLFEITSNIKNIIAAYPKENSKTLAEVILLTDQLNHIFEELKNKELRLCEQLLSQ